MTSKNKIWSSLIVAGICTLPLTAQEGDWKPAGAHRARYESADTASKSLLGRPITGRSKVDQSIERVGFGGDSQSAQPLPQAPLPQSAMGNSPGVETLPFPRSSTSDYINGAMPVHTMPPGARIQQPPLPSVSYPGAVTYPTSQGDSNTIQSQPIGGPIIVNGQMDGGYIPNGMVMDNGTIPGMDYSLGLSDRYYLQAIHGSPGIIYGSFDYMLMSITPDKAPALVITGPQTTTSILDGRVVYGGGIEPGDLPTDSLSGGRINLGVWFNRCQSWGMFGSYFTSVNNPMSFQAGSADGSTFFARPFFNTSTVNIDGTTRTPSEAIEQVSQLGTINRPALGGFVNIDRSSQLRGAELNFRFNLWRNLPAMRRIHWNIDGYAGVKYLGLEESLQITENIRVLNDFDPFPNDPNNALLLRDTRFLVQDTFKTRNSFIGANLGFLSEMRMGRFFVEMRTGIGLGGTNQNVEIGGFTQVTLPNGQALAPDPGGLLTQNSNIGTYSRSQFGYVPELGFKLGLQVTDHLRVFAGYDMLYWSNVVRPGQQIDRSVNASQSPQFPVPPAGELRPLFNYNTSSMWLTGFSAGISWIF